MHPLWNNHLTILGIGLNLALDFVVIQGTMAQQALLAPTPRVLSIFPHGITLMGAQHKATSGFSY